MTTEVGIGLGAQFWLDSASDVLTQLGEIISVGLPNSQVEDVEATHMASLNRRREYIAGLIDDGEATFEMNYVPNSATDQLIRAALSDGVTRDYKVVIPCSNGTDQSVEGDCIVKGYERNVPIDDRMTATLTIRFTGASSESNA